MIELRFEKRRVEYMYYGDSIGAKGVTRVRFDHILQQRVTREGGGWSWSEWEDVPIVEGEVV